MNKQELIKAVAAKHPELTLKAVTALVEDVLATVSASLLKEDKVSLYGFGIFETRERKARECRNPQTGEKMKVGAKKAIAFKPAKALKEALNK